MKVAAIIEYSRDAALIAATRPSHREYLTRLLSEGKLACSGPFTDDSGALIVYEAEDAAAAEKLLKADPFHDAGVFLTWQLRPWRTVMANRELF